MSARARAGRSSLYDENDADRVGRVLRAEDDNEVAPLPPRRARPCMEFLAHRFQGGDRPALNTTFDGNRISENYGNRARFARAPCNRVKRIRY